MLDLLFKKKDYCILNCFDIVCVLLVLYTRGLYIICKLIIFAINDYYYYYYYYIGQSTKV